MREREIEDEKEVKLFYRESCVNTPGDVDPSPHTKTTHKPDHSLEISGVQYTHKQKRHIV